MQVQLNTVATFCYMYANTVQSLLHTLLAILELITER